MYEVYSQQRPGHPRWTLAASAFVLLLSVGLAAAVSYQKSRALLIPLTSPQDYAGGQLRTAMPQRWELLPDSELPPGVVVSAQEPEDKDRRRRLSIFRGASYPLGLPLREGIAILRQQLNQLDLIEQEGEIEASRIGDLPGIELACAKRVRVSRVAYGTVYSLARIAVGPDGEAVGIVLTVPDAIEARDKVLLEQISQHLELTAIRKAPDPGVVMKAAGIRFDLPDDCLVFAEYVPGAARLRIAGGIGNTCWYLTACRVPLLPGRTPEALVRDFCLNWQDSPELPGRVQTRQENGRSIAQLQFSTHPRLPESVMLTCAQVDDETGLLLIGRHEGDARQQLLNLAGAMAGNADVRPYSESFDVADARKQARQWLDTVRSQGLRSLWGSGLLRRQTFTLFSPAVRLGSESRELVDKPRGTERWWELRVQSEIEPADLKTDEAWRIRDDTQNWEYVSIQTQGGRRRQYVEKWDGGKQVERELSGEGLRHERLNATADDILTTEPVLIAAAGGLSGADRPAGLLFSNTQLFTPDLCYWTLRPVGRLPLPGGSGTPQDASAVLAQRDYDGMPILLYFDDDRSLRAVQSAGGRYQLRTRNASISGNTNE